MILLIHLQEDIMELEVIMIKIVVEDMISTGQKQIFKQSILSVENARGVLKRLDKMTDEELAQWLAFTFDKHSNYDECIDKESLWHVLDMTLQQAWLVTARELQKKQQEQIESLKMVFMPIAYYNEDMEAVRQTAIMNHNKSLDKLKSHFQEQGSASCVAEMSGVSQIIIDTDCLTDDEQVKLWFAIHDSIRDLVADEKIVNILAVPRKEE